MRSLEAERNPGDPEAVHGANSASTPTGRYATPEEVANVVMYLCSDLSGDITGTHIVIDGGRSGYAARRRGGRYRDDRALLRVARAITVGRRVDADVITDLEAAQVRQLNRRAACGRRSD